MKEEPSLSALGCPPPSPPWTWDSWDFRCPSSILPPASLLRAPWASDFRGLASIISVPRPSAVSHACTHMVEIFLNADIKLRSGLLLRMCRLPRLLIPPKASRPCTQVQR